MKLTFFPVLGEEDEEHSQGQVDDEEGSKYHHGEVQQPCPPVHAILQSQ